MNTITKISILLLIILVNSTKSFAVTSILASACDKITLTDGRTLEIKIIKVTDDRVLFVSCQEKKEEKERVYFTKYISSIYISSQQKTVDYNEINKLKSINSKQQEETSEMVKDVLKVSLISVGVFIVAIGAGIYIIYRALLNLCIFC